MLKNTLLKLALTEAAKDKKGVEKLVDAVNGQCAVVTSDLNPFRLFRQLDATKTKMPARGGEIAPDDIEIKAGDTPFKPGPVVGELQKAGLPAAIEQGKVVIKKDKILVKKGDKIPRDVALVLSKLAIYPLTVGLDLQAVFEEGMIYKTDVLAVDDAEYRARIQRAAIERDQPVRVRGVPDEAVHQTDAREGPHELVEPRGQRADREQGHDQAHAREGERPDAVARV